jgi:riboflavin kinase/FMN adenylyltransferase
VATCGFNYRFGKGAACDTKDLTGFFENNGGSVQISEEIMLGEVPLSSTLLRGFIENGEIERLEEFGTKYSVYEKVVEGKRLGKRLGFPTINQKIPTGKVVPKRGVYITECEIGEDVYPAITNVGIRPSIDDGDEMNMETYILGFNGMLYNSYIKVNFYKYLRGEIKFSSLSELSVQINKDKREAEKYFK